MVRHLGRRAVKACEGLELICGSPDLCDGAERAFRDARLSIAGGESEDQVPDRRREPKEAHNLSHPGAGDTLSAGDLRLARDFSVVELPSPLLGFAEELDHCGRPQLPGLGRSARLRGRAHDTVSGDTPFQGAHAPVLERPLGPQGDLDRLFEQLGLGDDVVAVRSHV